LTLLQFVTVRQTVNRDITNSNNLCTQGIISIGLVTAVAIAQQFASGPMYKALGNITGRFVITIISAIFQFTMIEILSKINRSIAYRLNVWGT